MGDIAQRGNRLTNKHISKDLVRNVYEHVAPKHSPGQKGKPHSSKEGRTASIGRTVRDTMKILTGADRVKKFGGGRTNLLEQLGRVEAEPSNPNRRAEISRVHGELNRGYAKGGRAGFKHGTKPDWKKGKFGKKTIAAMKKHDFPAGGPHQSLEGKKAALQHATIRAHEHKHGRDSKVAGGLVKNIPKLLKRLGKEIKDQPLPPQLQKTLDEVKKLQQLQKPKVKKAEGGRIGRAVGGGLTRRKWMNPLEQMGGSPKGKPHSTKEGRIAAGKRRLQRMKQKAMNDYHDQMWAGKDAEKGKPHSSQEGRIATGRRNFKRFLQKRVGAKKGGSDKKWIQKAVNPKHKGYCTPMTKKTCTPARKALARTFKKKAKTGWG